MNKSKTNAFTRRANLGLIVPKKRDKYGERMRGVRRAMASERKNKWCNGGQLRYGVKV